MPVAVVTGAFSFTGRFIAQELLGRGWKVRTLTNSSYPGDPLADRIAATPLQFTDHDALAESIRGADVLFNTYWVRYPHAGDTSCPATILAAAGSVGRRGTRRRAGDIWRFACQCSVERADVEACVTPHSVWSPPKPKVSCSAAQAVARRRIAARIRARIDDTVPERYLLQSCQLRGLGLGIFSVSLTREVRALPNRSFAASLAMAAIGFLTVMSLRPALVICTSTMRLVPSGMPT